MTRYSKKSEVKFASTNLTISTVTCQRQPKKQSGGRLALRPLFGLCGRTVRVTSLTQAFTPTSTKVTGTVCFTPHLDFTQKLISEIYLRGPTLTRSAPMLKIRILDMTAGVVLGTRRCRLTLDGQKFSLRIQTQPKLLHTSRSTNS